MIFLTILRMAKVATACNLDYFCIGTTITYAIIDLEYEG